MIVTGCEATRHSEIGTRMLADARGCSDSGCFDDLSNGWAARARWVLEPVEGGAGGHADLMMRTYISGVLNDVHLYQWSS